MSPKTKRLLRAYVKAAVNRELIGLEPEEEVKPIMCALRKARKKLWDHLESLEPRHNLMPRAVEELLTQ